MLLDSLVKQENITVNFLRNSRMSPSLSAYAQIFGQLNYDATPFTLPGSKYLFHEKTAARGT